MKNIETLDKMHLGKLINQLRDGRFVIPDFQREFKWTPADVKELLKSVFEDYYIGTLLLWRASRENQKILSCEPIYGFKEIFGEKADTEHIVLDGQQRLSALFYAFFAPNKPFPKRKTRCLFVVNLENLMAEDYENAIEYEWLSRKVKKLLEDKEGQFEKKIFPLNILGKESARDLYKWLEGYEKYWSKKIGSDKAGKQREKIEKFFNELLASYDVSYIELDRAIEVSKVCDIFTKINSTGITLNIFDLLNALLRPKDIFLKEMWRKAEKELGDFRWQNSNVQLLQTMSVLEQRYCAPKYLYYLVPGTPKQVKRPDGLIETEELISSNEEFLKKWNSAVEKIKQTINKLKNQRDFGAIKPKFVPYPTMLPILASLYAEKEKDIYLDKKSIEEKIKRWYWASIFTQNYSSSVESQIARDFQEMQKWFQDETKAPRVIEQLENELHNIDLRTENRPGSAIYKAIFNILVIKGAKDWNTFNLPEYSVLEDHHIVPRSWGKKYGLNDKIDTILNRTPLSSDTNRLVIANKLPNVYLREMFRKNKNLEEVYELLESHLISKKAVDILMRKEFSKEDFEEFVKERQKTIIDEIKKFLKIKEKPQKGLITPETPFSNKLQIEQLVKSCNDFIYWIDRYFSKVGLEIIIQSLQSIAQSNLKEIKILTSIDKVDLSLRKSFKDFRKELENKGIRTELRVIPPCKTRSEIHDRWVITQGRIYNLPSVETLQRGQFSEINETQNRPPFEKWWKESLNIITDWDKIERLRKNYDQPKSNNLSFAVKT